MVLGGDQDENNEKDARKTMAPPSNVRASKLGLVANAESRHPLLTRVLRLTLLILLAAGFLATPSRAADSSSADVVATASVLDVDAPQTQRSDFTFHVYVDPLYGDNTQAMQWNPGGAGAPGTGAMAPPSPLATHPYIDPVTSQAVITGVLQHAPYPFKTITGQFGALAYLDQILPNLPAPIGTAGLSVEYVVIHCLPGLYGPTSPITVDPQSGLPFNGEEFPISLRRDRVSIQGSSALDTIFDARGSFVRILQFFDPVAGASENFENSFVDGVCFRNARAKVNVPWSGAAIEIAGFVPVAATISNCFFIGNDIGISVDGTGTQFGNCQAFVTHEAKIFNNTFAWNAIGIWSGNTGAPITSPCGWNGIPPFPRILHRCAIANNIFDIGVPAGFGFPAPLSAFEGVDSEEREVISRGGVQVVDPVSNRGLDFNAIPDKRNQVANRPLFYNIGATVAPRPAPYPVNSQAEIPARVDLTDLSVQPRTFFIADALRLAPNGVLSMHDLRLCPNVSAPNSATGAPSAALLNPCLNMGIDAGLPASLTIGFATGTALCGGRLGLSSYGQGIPGICPVADAEEAPLSGWDCDGEGFGNDRIALPYGLPPCPDLFGCIDIGADEIDDLSGAGFLDGTRIFSHPNFPGASPVVTDHQRVFFFGRIGTSMPRPQFSTELGQLFPWHQHVQAPTDTASTLLPPVVASNFSDVQPWTPLGLFPLRIDQIHGGVPQRPLVPRNLECDFGGHLAPDMHPYWGLMMAFGESPPGFPPNWNRADHYGTNAWCYSSPTPPASLTNHVLANQLLFHNLGGAAPHRTTLTNNGVLGGFGVTFVMSGHIHPPGTFVPATTNGSWLLSPVGQFGPYGACSNSTLSFGAFCFNDAPGGCPDTLPIISGEQDFGRRFNLEPVVAPGAHRNLQTFLAIARPPTEPTGGAGSSNAQSNIQAQRGAVREAGQRAGAVLRARRER